MGGPPLCVDLDGTLIGTDLLVESVLQLLKRNILFVFAFPFWLLRGRSHLKACVAERTRLRYQSLPYRPEIVELIHRARREGRQVVLATASMASQAEGVASHLGLFDRVEASSATVNLAGRRKADRLVALFGEKGFDYVGDSAVDLEVWRHCGRAHVVGASDRLAVRARAVCAAVESLRHPGSGVRSFLRAIRIHQWLKNLLVFIPVLAAHEVDQPLRLGHAMLGFLAFGLCASAVYVLNDLLDLESDRQHRSKHRRPFASGTMPVSRGLLIIPVFLAGSAWLATRLPPPFGLVLASYFVATSLYSFWLKRQVVVDIILLAALYTSRILAGAAASEVVPSFWLLAFSMFLFLSLGVVKRYTELRDAAVSRVDRPAGRGYSVEDLPLVLNLGVCSGMLATLVFAMYINSPETRATYRHNEFLWPAAPALLYWISRVWMKAHRGQIDDDPVVFAATDRQSWAVVAIVLACFFAASR